MIFEIHITGDESIHSVAAKRQHKTITLQLVRPNYSLIRLDHMTSIIMPATDLSSALAQLKEIEKYYIDNGVDIKRVKMECPLTTAYKDYVRDAVYAECHFEASNSNLPTSRNVKKNTFSATDRCYNHSLFLEFYFEYLGLDIELCVLDTNDKWDVDWTTYWGNFCYGRWT
jgi:hypothetical protein